MARHGPTSGRLIPILLDSVSLPPFLNTIQVINGRHRDAARVAAELAAMVGRFESLPEGVAENADRLVVYLDNLESLLIGPEDVGPADPNTFGQWWNAGPESHLVDPDAIRPRHDQGHRGR